MSQPAKESTPDVGKVKVSLWNGIMPTIHQFDGRVYHIADYIAFNWMNKGTPCSHIRHAYCMHPGLCKDGDDHIQYDDFWHQWVLLTQEGEEKGPKNYPILQAYRHDALRPMYDAVLESILASDSSLSPARAGELAAAKLALFAGVEREALENAVRFMTPGTIGFARVEIALYDWLVYARDIKDVLKELSGTRTLHEDMPVE